MWLQLRKSTLAALFGRDGQIYFQLGEVAGLLNKIGAYSFAKPFQFGAILGKGVLFFHKDYPIITKKTTTLSFQLIEPPVRMRCTTIYLLKMSRWTPVLSKHLILGMPLYHK
ncbi:hypothetical protein NPIL_346231 [Nephila pilipes]|uniref:Uncharacterized protein n=1 Tax=Nephila pilipes TaxID=299642 RepID=A0A8X6QGW7_NEPPI|nr:hypothetical protein NPIL_346231 [Nephila pilipes]